MKFNFNQNIVVLTGVMAFLVFWSCSDASNNVESEKKDSELLAMVLKNGQYGFINTKGEFVIEPTYGSPCIFSNGLACVTKGNGYYGSEFVFIDINEDRKLKEITRDRSVFFYDGFATCMINDTSYGFMNLKGEVVGEGFTLIYPFINDVAFVENEYENIIGGVRTDGTLRYSFDMEDYVAIGDFNDSLAWIEEKESRLFGYINKSGEMVLPPIYENPLNFSEGLTAITVPGESADYFSFNFMNYQGDTVITDLYDFCGEFKEGLCPVKKDGYWGFINKKGEIVVDFNFSDAFEFSEGLAAVESNGLIGFIDAAGEWVIEPKFEKVKYFKNGYCIFKEKGKFGFMNRKGEVVVKPEYHMVDNFVHPDESNWLDPVMNF
jgi:hypothetical protein